VNTSIKTFRLTGDRNLAACPLNELLEPTERSSAGWIDVQPDQEATLAELLHALDLHPLALDACVDDSPPPGMTAYGDSLVIVLPTHAAWDAEDRTHLIVVCLPRLLVTIHRQAIPALEQVAVQYADGMRFHADNTSAILYQILDHIIDEDVAFTLRARDEINRLDDLLERHDDDVIEQALPLKRQITRLAAAFEDQLYCVGSLQTVESNSFQIEGLRDYFRDACTHLEHASRAAGRQLAHLNAIQQAYQLHLQDKTNDRLRLLTIVSTIFIPLTLITGIYGMNFHNMPELQWQFGYVGTLLAMLALGLAMLWGFYRTGWFR